MEAILRDAVHHSLRDFLHRNAIFLCERLCAEFPSETNLQLLAGCYLHSNQAYAAYHILKGTQVAQSRYLFAMSCYQMNLLHEAEAALSPANEPSAEVPNGAAGHYLLGLIYRYTDRRKSAIQHFKQALTIDPLMWAAYEELCVLGSAEEAAVVFGEAASVTIQKQYLHHGLASQSLLTTNDDCNLVYGRNFSFEDVSPRQLKLVQGSNTRDSFGNSHVIGVSGQPTNGSSNISFYNTPSPMPMQLSGTAPPPVCRAPPVYLSSGTDSSPRSTISSTIQSGRRKFVDEGKLRKISSRLSFDSGNRRSNRLAAEAAANTNASVSMAAGNGTTNSSKIGSSKLGSVARSLASRKGQPWANENLDEGVRNEAFDDSRSNTASISGFTPTSETRYLEQDGATLSVGGGIMNASKVMSGASELLNLLRILGEGYRLSCMYKCQDALDAFLKLSYKHYNTSWVLCQVGKAYSELLDYFEADRAFSRARQASPYSLEGMDIYSTVLYLLNEDMKLSYLAQELLSTDRLAPQSWCAMGNCYSLQKDHETALKNFQRAVQLNSKFTYAHTLCGHEYVALDDFENGMKSYQSALRLDARHYNSWFGLGMIYFRQEKFEFAEHHFRMANQINPCSSVIASNLGTALHALQRSDEALAIMEKAIRADEKNPVPMYHKANILMSLEKFDEALAVLEELNEYSPRESSVHALMGRIYKRRNMHDKAMLHFGIALDLKPSTADVTAIKAAIERLLVPDELEDSL
ncbi:cell division cycle protein 27 homolog B isoform X2 [Argentina anserina]|uniref:cell division cycle protein 27 homolog B isoform X2 n=1 Tax=Argentina anserina TaxID=57926 RepID=UPI00217680F8|nr:cell division cycle protein 27 homolog B isoform X2 [Potentilla anserina]